MSCDIQPWNRRGKIGAPPPHPPARLLAIRNLVSALPFPSISDGMGVVVGEVIAYVAPSVVASIEEQIAVAEQRSTRWDWVRVDRPKKPTGPVPREQRDFVMEHLLRTGDKLWVYSLDVLGDSRREILNIFKALHGLEIVLISETDNMDGDQKATAYAIALEAALTRAEGRIDRRNAERFLRRRLTKDRKTGGRPKALRPAEVEEALAMRQARKTWPEIVAHFAEKGVKVGITALRRAVAAKRTE